jgi:hypothetical protein
MQILRKCWLTIPRSEEYQCVVMNMLMYGQYPVTTCQDIVMPAPWIFLRAASTINVEFVTEGIFIFVWSAMNLRDVACKMAMV